MVTWGFALSWDNDSQGMNVSGARENLREAIELFYEAAPAEEVQRRLHSEVYVTQVDVTIG